MMPFGDADPSLFRTFTSCWYRRAGSSQRRNFNLERRKSSLGRAHYLPPKGRDLRLDLFRGVANWATFLDHIPGRSTLHTLLLFVIYLAEIGYLAQKYRGDQLADEFNIRGFLANPALTLYEGPILRSKPVNMDVLALYIVLMGLFPPILVTMLKRPNIVLFGSIVLYVVARAFGWNLPAYPVGHWYFNPFAWQLLCVFGAWFALGGSAEATPFIRFRLFLVLGIAYLLFALAVTVAGPFPELQALIPDNVYSLFSSNGKTNLAPYRIVHFAVIAFIVVRFLPRDWTVCSRDRVRPTIARGFLRRHIPVVCGLFCPGRDLWRAADANSGQPRRDRSHDRPCLLSILVQADGQGEACTGEYAEGRTPLCLRVGPHKRNTPVRLPTRRLTI
jgi:hypothetical protein